MKVVTPANSGTMLPLPIWLKVLALQPGMGQDGARSLEEAERRDVLERRLEAAMRAAVRSIATKMRGEVKLLRVWLEYKPPQTQRWPGAGGWCVKVLGIAQKKKVDQPRVTKPNSRPRPIPVPQSVD